MILRAIYAVLGMWRLDPAQAILLSRRISRTAEQIERLLLRFRAGTLPVVTSRAVTAKRRDGSAARGPTLPRNFGWLVIAGKHHAVCYGLQLQTVLNEPEMVELLAASAQARRVLRPLCRALALEMPWCPAKPKRAISPSDKVSVRKRRPRPKPEPFRIPLPRGVLSAARRQGFGKLR